MDFISFLDKHVAVSIWIIGAIAFLCSIVAFYKNFSTVCEMVKKFINSVKKLFDIRKKRKRRKYNKVVSSSAYLEWQNKTLYEIYGPIITIFKERNNSSHNFTFGKAVCFPDTAYEYFYEAIYFKVNENEYPYPFVGICGKDELTKCQIFEKKITHTKYIKFKPKNRAQKKFYNLMKPTIHFPNNIGYALNEMSFENGFHFKANSCTYKMNICTSNIMEYELYKLYIKEKKGKKINKNKLEELKIRNNIHKEFSDNLENIFTSGAGRYSLLGVQAMVLCKNNFTGNYDVLRIRRSENVDAKSGFLQFVPSGGFSALNNSLDYDTQYFEFSVAKAILRELLEECFGEDDFSGRKLNSTENIYSDSIIDKLLNDKGLIFKFLGSAFSLVSLRHELCFLLVIEDKELVNLIRENDECSNVMQFVSIKDLENPSFWIYDVGTEKVNDCKLLNPTSAALWNMVQKTDIYKKIEELF